MLQGFQRLLHPESSLFPIMTHDLYFSMICPSAPPMTSGLISCLSHLPLSPSLVLLQPLSLHISCSSPRSLPPQKSTWLTSSLASGFCSHVNLENFIVLFNPLTLPHHIFRGQELCLLHLWNTLGLPEMFTGEYLCSWVLSLLQTAYLPP